MKKTEGFRVSLAGKKVKIGFGYHAFEALKRESDGKIIDIRYAWQLFGWTEKHSAILISKTTGKFFLRKRGTRLIYEIQEDLFSEEFLKKFEVIPNQTARRVINEILKDPRVEAAIGKGE